MVANTSSLPNRCVATVQRSVESTAAPTPHEFVANLFDPDDLIEFRALSHAGTPPTGRSFCNLADLRDLDEYVLAYNDGHSIYFGVNPRSHEGGTRADVACCRSLVADFDNVPLPIALERVDNAGLPEPTSVVETGGGYHLYWRLEEPIELDLWEGLQRRLIAALDSDPKVCDAPRIMRLPGTVNRKPERDGAPCRVVSLGGDRFTLQELSAPLPRFESSPSPRASSDQPSPGEHDIELLPHRQRCTSR
jgi:hypothetical protein